jgi:acetylornithine/N-succinyldiaminopimelate aminotransferase
LQEVRRICDEKDILLILDEIQCGMGRTGSMFAWQQYGVKPDIMTSAKALGCGVPVGAFVLNEKTAKASLVPGDHGTTYGGNPLACAAVNAVFEQFEELQLLQHVQEIAAYLEEKLDALAAKHSCIQERRGMGLMQGLQLEEGKPVGEIITAAREKGLLVISAEHNVLRMLPPLVITKADVDKAVEILDSCF